VTHLRLSGYPQLLAILQIRSGTS